jgi:chromosome segregation ATPase
VEETTRLTRLLEAAAARCDSAERRAEENRRQHDRERGELEREVERLRGMASSFSDEARMSMHFNSAELGEARRRAADAEASLRAASEALDAARRDAESAKRDAKAANEERESAVRDKVAAEAEREMVAKERDSAVERLEAAEVSSKHRVEELEGEVEGLCALAEEERRAKVDAEESMKLVQAQLEVFRGEERCRGAEWKAARAALEAQNERCDPNGVLLSPLLHLEFFFFACDVSPAFPP